jgi:hypothetical protein
VDYYAFSACHMGVDALLADNDGEIAELSRCARAWLLHQTAEPASFANVKQCQLFVPQGMLSCAVYAVSADEY